MMLFLHEVHEVIGEHEDAFDEAYREGWLTTLAAGDDARLLWYFHHAHGAGPSYNVVTVTGIRDGAAWERLSTSLLEGELRDWRREVDLLRRRVTGKLLLPVTWSPIQSYDLAEVPTVGVDHDPSLFMQDTGWPDAPLDDYIEFWDASYYRFMKRTPEEHRLLDVQGCFQVAHGSGYRPEAILWQRVEGLAALEHLLTNVEEYDPDEWPGSYMHEGLKLRDQWESKLLRTTRWSPLW